MASNTQSISGSISEQSAVEAPKVTPQVPPILHVAWERYAQLNTMSRQRSRAFRRLRIGVAVLGILATLFAIITELISEESGWLPASLSGLPEDQVEYGIRVIFISIPIIASFLVAFGSRAFSAGDWLITRAAAEEYLKEIYLYRTIHQKKKNRGNDLVDRLYEIQKQLYRALGGELAFEPYKGRVPPYYDPADSTSDNGYDDLDGEKYFRFRLKHQLAWHQRRINDFKRERGLLTLLVLAVGGLGTLFAALAQPFSIWVALTASVTTALVGWQELRNIDSVIRNYSKVILELTNIHDDWVNLKPEDRTTRKFYQMVRATEDVLWAQHQEYIRSQQQALQEALKDADRDSETLQETLEENIEESTEKALKKARKEVSSPLKQELVTRAAEASAEVIRPELEAMGQAVADAAGTMQESTSSMGDGLQEVAQNIDDDKVNGDSSGEASDTPADNSKPGEAVG